MTPIPEPRQNATSNAAYAVAALAYVAVFAAHGTPSALLAAFGLFALSAGSWSYHGWPSPRTNLYDHVGMHLAFAGVAAFCLQWGFNTSLAAAALVYAGLLVFAAAMMLCTGRLSSACSRRAIVVSATFYLVGLVATGWTEAVLTGSLFGFAFVFHHDHQMTPTNFGPRHAVWHVLTASGFGVAAACALL